MNILEYIATYFSKPDLDEVMAFQYKLPRSIVVEIKREGDHFIARVKEINGEAMDKSTVITEAKNRVDLIKEINDILLTYLDFPENIKPRMPQLLPEGLTEAELSSLNKKELVFAK